MASHRFDAQMKVDLFLKDFKLMLEEGSRLEVASKHPGYPKEVLSTAYDALRRSGR